MEIVEQKPDLDYSDILWQEYRRKIILLGKKLEEDPEYHKPPKPFGFISVKLPNAKGLPICTYELIFRALQTSSTASEREEKVSKFAGYWTDFNPAKILEECYTIAPEMDKNELWLWRLGHIKTKAELDRFGNALKKIFEETPNCRFKVDRRMSPKNVDTWPDWLWDDPTKKFTKNIASFRVICK